MLLDLLAVKFSLCLIWPPTSLWPTIPQRTRFPGVRLPTCLPPPTPCIDFRFLQTRKGSHSFRSGGARGSSCDHRFASDSWKASRGKATGQESHMARCRLGLCHQGSPWGLIGFLTTSSSAAAKTPRFWLACYARWQFVISWKYCTVSG